MTARRDLSEYLAAEWGEDWERATEDWPFVLAEVGALFLTGEQRYVALAETEGAEDVLRMEGEPSLPVPRVRTSPWRRLARAAGVRLDSPRAASGGAPEA